MGLPRLGGCVASTHGSPDRITVDPSVRFGKPCVRGTRLTVGDVLGYLAAGMSEAEVLADFPQLTREDCWPATHSPPSASGGS
jgi:uncharacterized protein (DUF433 family)